MTASAFISRGSVLSGLRRLKNLTVNALGNPVVVLCYHRVAVKMSDIQSVAVSPDNFHSHMEYLKRRFLIARFDEHWGRFKKPAIVVTFDDGYADNTIEALPILEALEVPATFFVSSGFVGATDEIWWDKLERMVLRGADYPLRFALDDVGHGRSWPTASLEERKNMYWDLHQLARSINATQKAILLEQIEKWCGNEKAAGEEGRALTVAELKTLADSEWVTIGAHTVTHPCLSTLTEQEQRIEIISSKEQLENLLGRQIEVFSYPFGKKTDYNEKSVRICREAGFLKAAAAFPGAAYRWTDPYQIPRYFVSDWNMASFTTFLKELGL